MKPKYCKYCKKYIEVRGRFCPRCGNLLQDSPEELEENGTEVHAENPVEAERTVHDQDSQIAQESPQESFPDTSATPEENETAENSLPPVPDHTSSPASGHSSKTLIYIAIAAIVGGVAVVAFMSGEKEETPKTSAPVQTQTQQKAARSPESMQPVKRQSKAIDDSTPDGAFKRYHQLITKHQLKEAYLYFSPEFTESIGDYNTWAAGYQNTISSVPEVKVMGQDADSATLQFLLHATDRVGNGKVTNNFLGTCHMVRIHGQWKISDMSVQKA